MAIVQKLLLKTVAKTIGKKFRLDEIVKYVFEPNQNNEDIAEIKNRLKNVEALSHPQREFVRCCQCNSKIKENNIC